jgi:tetratricopeptide (TPR) repeat protein
MNDLSSFGYIAFAIAGAIFSIYFAQALISLSQRKAEKSSFVAERRGNRLNVSLSGNPAKEDIEMAIHNAIVGEPVGIRKANRIDNVFTYRQINEEVWIDLAIYQRSSGRFEEAVLSLDQALKINPSHHGAWFQKGLALGELKRFTESIDSYQNAILFSPDYVEALLSLGILYHYQKMPTEARAAFKRVLKIDPENHIAIQFLQLLSFSSAS